MIKSNIGISSNIYIRSNPNIANDRKYTEKITGAKRLRQIRSRFVGLESIPLTAVQSAIISGNQTCSNAKNKEMSFGAIIEDGKLRWANRCEYMECKGYNGCKPRIIARETICYDSAEETKSLQEFFEKLGINIKDDTIEFERDRNVSITEEEPKEYIKPSEPDKQQISELSRLYTEINDPEPIISAALNSHIILNSGPGTGKTYTIIQRLIYILENELCPADEIYILCYTRSAKNVVENKIKQAVIDGILQPSANNICVLTFDSYATYFLMAMKEQGVITENFDAYGYNDRIKLFNKYISVDDFENISYFIVDEIQDLVNDRAEMVLKILKNLKCGYLLAGDRCQAIYDYEADDDATLDSVKFYELAENLFPYDMQRYEIVVNRRQTPELAHLTGKMRNVLLNGSFSEQNKCANDIVYIFSTKTKVEQYIKTLTQQPTVSTAILCRNNGEAEYISALLCEKGINHNLNRGVNNVVSLPRWIADVFWDYCRDTISKKDFIERFTFRGSCGLNADLIWTLLCKITGEKNDSVINMATLIKALSIANNIPGEFFDEPSMLTVSTIHKAKGSEFDRVILIESDISSTEDNAEEARVRYVALTRPKNQFFAMKKNSKYFKRTISGRVMETGFHNLYNRTNRYCKSINVGLHDDIDNTAFVSGDFDNILDLQEYIINNVKLYDRVYAQSSYYGGQYQIYHNGHCIGSLSKNMTDEIEIGVKSTDYKYNLPDSLENLYVSGITTEILKQFNDKIPIEYQKSRICFGIKITGLAKLIFEKK